MVHMSLPKLPTDRRQFLVRIAVTAGGSAMASLLPVSLLQAGENCAAVTYADPCGDWAVDDMCNAFPGYAYDFRRAPTPAVPLAANLTDADRQWVA
jgi:hypothetical protein